MLTSATPADFLARLKLSASSVDPLSLLLLFLNPFPLPLSFQSCFSAWFLPARKIAVIGLASFLSDLCSPVDPLTPSSLFVDLAARLSLLGSATLSYTHF